jgi:hypothetical protein
MKICDLQSGSGQLAQAFSHLKESWIAAKAHWHDEASRAFEEQHLHEIPARLQVMTAAVQRLTDALAQAERECEDRTEEV